VRITVTRTGGIAGVRLAAEVDTAQLDPAVGASVEQAVARLLGAPGADAGVPPHPDAFTYRIARADDPSGPAAVLHEGRVPPELRLLVEEVSTRGRPG
jgi:hypothetical protein